MALVGGMRGGQMSHLLSSRRKSMVAPRTRQFGCVKMPKVFIANDKKKSRLKLTQERIRQFSIWFFEQEDQREEENTRRRRERKRRKKTEYKNTGALGRCLHLLYCLDAVVWIVGGTFTLCSTVKSIGENTIFYEKRTFYRIIGPLTVFLAVCLLFLATGLKHRLHKKSNKPRRQFYILNQKTNAIKVKEQNDLVKDPEKDSGNEADIEMDTSKIIKKQSNTRNTDKTFSSSSKKRQVERQDTAETVDSEEYLLETGTSDEGAHETSVDLFKGPFRDRKSWAKTKWMRVEEDGSDESVELEDLTNYHHINECEEPDSGDMYVDKIPETVNTKARNDPERNRRSRPNKSTIMRGCFTQSSTKSQDSTVTAVSTVSESAHLL